MKKLLTLSLVVAGLLQVHAAMADDYRNGYESGYNGYYGGTPDNQSSADYVQGYNHGQSVQHQSYGAQD